MVPTMDQAMTLGAYAGTIVLPLVRQHAGPSTVRVIDGIVQELWAGLPLVYDRSYFDQDMSEAAVQRAMTSGYGVDKSRSPVTPEDLVSEILDMVRSFWQLAHRGSPRELAQVVTFRLGELAAGMDSLYAVMHDSEMQARPGLFEAVVRECLDLVRSQRATGAMRALGDQDLYDHAIVTGTHLIECIDQGARCRMLTKPQFDRLSLQITTLFTASGFNFVSEDGAHGPGVRVEVIDDIDPSARHVAVYWHPGHDIHERCDVAGDSGHFSADVLHRSRVVGIAMSRAIEEILEAAGFEVLVDLEVGGSYVLVTALKEPDQFTTFIEGPDELSIRE